MNFKMYRYTGEKNVINKRLTHVEDLSGYFKDDTEYLTPTLVLAPGYSINTENYFIIDGRNYFVTGVIYSQQNLQVRLELDELETFKAAILNEYAIFDRSTNIFNAYQVDEDIPFINSNEITITNFPSGFSGESLILTVAGGGVPI